MFCSQFFEESDIMFQFLVQLLGLLDHSRIQLFLKGKGGFSKVVKNFVVFFFSVEQIGFPSTTRALKLLCFGQIFCAAGKVLKKQATKIALRHTLETLDQKIAFFWRAFPSKLANIFANGALGKILRPAKNRHFKIVQRGILWVGWVSNL